MSPDPAVAAVMHYLGCRSEDDECADGTCVVHWDFGFKDRDYWYCADAERVVEIVRAYT